jgi:hypothetical protein
MPTVGGLLNAGLIYLMVSLDHIDKAGQNVPALGTCFQADNLQAKVEALAVRCRQYVSNLGAEH